MNRPNLQKVSRAILLALFGLLTACTSNSQDAELIARDLETAAGRLKIGEILRMDAINAGKWDRLFLFPPYTPNRDMEVALNSKLPSSIIEARISERDDANLLVFMNAGDVQVVAAVVRSAVDFSTPSPQPITRERAQFRKPASGGKLVWVDQN